VERKEQRGVGAEGSKERVPESTNECQLGFGTGIPRVGFSHTVPEPGNTVPVPGTGTYRTVKLAVSYGTRGTIGTRGFF